MTQRTGNFDDFGMATATLAGALDAKLQAIANNLANVSAQFPLGLFTCVTGVSGGGKSTLVVETLYNALARKLMGARVHAGAHERIEYARWRNGRCRAMWSSRSLATSRRALSMSTVRSS